MKKRGYIVVLVIAILLLIGIWLPVDFWNNISRTMTGNVIYNEGNYSDVPFGPPFDVFDNYTLIFNVTPETGIVVGPGENLTLNVVVNQTRGLIYKTAYYYDAKNDSWPSFNFSEATANNSNWIADYASATITIPYEQVNNGNNLISAYSCKKYFGAWQCGCKSDEENGCKNWMLQIAESDRIECNQNSDCLQNSNVSWCSGLDSYTNTTNYVCFEHKCVPNILQTNRSCIDFTSCTSDSCLQGACVNNLNAGCKVCTQDANCTSNEYCLSGACTLKSSGIGTGTVLDPFMIYNCEELQNIQKGNAKSNYALARDIDCSNIVFSAISPMAASNCPACYYSYFFKGGFDGRDHIISNLNGNGLFGMVASGFNMKNVGLVNATIEGHGGFVSLVKGLDTSTYTPDIGCNISTCNITNSFIFNGNILPAGYLYSSNGFYEVKGTGGLVGQSGGVYWNGGDGKFYSSGGILIKDSYFIGNISGGRYAGGLVGYGAGIKMINSYTSSYVERVTDSYGEINSAAVIGCGGQNVPRCCYNSTLNRYVVPENMINITQNVFWNSDLLPPENPDQRNRCTQLFIQSNGAFWNMISGCYGKTTSQMKQQSTYTGWDFVNIWAIDPTKNNGYPYLKWQNL
jgi:hypothetical protein